MLQFTFEKNILLCKKGEKNNLSRGKIPAPPPWISNGPSLMSANIVDDIGDELSITTKLFFSHTGNLTICDL